ncbi:hypothetical protein SDC9_187718 [bioreactor metagenome]|uniref:Uncharacterized protein n=1 Tax=bioreactor metagenome TaxID=1076179 RepID=A0A645HNZ8_9ZZZZ
MLKRTHVLPTHAVVADPFVLVVVFCPGKVSNVTYIDIHSWKFDLPYDSPTVDRVCYCVE